VKCFELYQKGSRDIGNVQDFIGKVPMNELCQGDC
jgi:hypothetical protein